MYKVINILCKQPPAQLSQLYNFSWLFIIQELYDHWYLELTNHEVIHPVPMYQAFEVC